MIGRVGQAFAGGAQLATERGRALVRRYVTADDRRLLSSGVAVAAGAALTQLFTVVKELLVARRFGTGDSIDAYLIAFVLPSFAINVVAASFSAAVIPTFIDVRNRRGRDAAQALFSTVVAWSMALLAVTAMLLALCFPAILPLLASSFSPEKRELTRRLVYVLSPILVINGMATIWAAILNAENRFLETALAPCAVPAITIMSLLLLAPRYGIYALAGGVVAGMMLQMAYVAWVLARTGYSLRPTIGQRPEEARAVIAQYIPLVAGGALMSGMTLVDQAMAATLPAGSVATLGYAIKIPSALLTVSAMGVGTVALPHVSELASAADWTGIRRLLARYVRGMAVALVILTVLLVMLSPAIIHVMFERGAFTAADTARVARVQALFVLQLPFYVIGMLYVRVISALKRNDLLWWGTVISLPLNVVGDWLLMRRWGVDGIAVSTVLVYVAACLYMWIVLRRLLGERDRSVSRAGVVSNTTDSSGPS